jgi:type I restriction enzyme S subunit
MSNFVPEGWTLSNVDKTCDVLDSKRIPINSEERSTRKGQYPYYGANGIQGFIDNYIFEGEHILLAEDGGNFDQWEARPISYLVSGKFWVNNHAHILRAKNGNETRFLHYSLVHKNITKHINGGTRAKLNQSDMRDIELALPPLPEQQKIAAILTAVDDVIESTQTQINKLKDLKTGLMQELLSKGIGHTEFKDSPVGRIPKAWASTTFSGAGIKILDGDRGSEYPKDADFFDYEYCLFLSAKNVTKSGFQFNQLVFITKEKDEKLRKGKLQKGDIVITTRGTVGNIAFFDKNIHFENVRINSGMAIIRNDEENFNSDFLNAVLHSRLVGEQIELLAFGSAQPQLTIGVIQNINLPLPSQKEQMQIVEIMNSVQERLNLVKSKLDQLSNAKKALMQDLLTGKVRVNTVSCNKEVLI